MEAAAAAAMEQLELLVKSVTWEAEGIHSYELRLPSGTNCRRSTPARTRTCTCPTGGYEVS